MLQSQNSLATLEKDEFCFNRKQTERIYTCLKTTGDLQVQIEKLNFCPVITPQTFFESSTGQLTLFLLGGLAGYGISNASKR